MHSLSTSISEFLPWLFRRPLSCHCVLYNKNKPKLQFGLDKIERKQLRKKLSQAHIHLSPTHVYKQSSFSNKFDLTEFLIKNEVYNEDGLIAVNKPYGVRRYKESDLETDSKSITQSLNATGSFSSSSIEETLPLLQEHYKNKLEMVFFPERYCSGLVLFSSEQSLTARIKKSFRASVNHQIPYQSYLAVVRGVPVPETVEKRVALGFQHVPDGNKVPVIVEAYSKRKVLSGEIKTNVVHQRTLAHHSQSDASLVQVDVMNIKHSFLRVWLAQCCSPILGDVVYGPRVKSVLGNRVLVNLNSIKGYSPPDLPEELLRHLCLSRGQRELIPVHSHLAKVTLSHFKGKEPLVIEAPPPEHFDWTCKRLSLILEDETK